MDNNKEIKIKTKTLSIDKWIQLKRVFSTVNNIWSDEKAWYKLKYNICK